MIDIWRRLRPDYIGTIYRVAFRRIACAAADAAMGVERG
jgi:hypothetical protein